MQVAADSTLVWTGLKVEIQIFLFNDPSQPLFAYFRSFQIQLYRKFVVFCRIRTRTVGVEDQCDDRLTNTTAPNLDFLISSKNILEHQPQVYNFAVFVPDRLKSIRTLQFAKAVIAILMTLGQHFKASNL